MYKYKKSVAASIFSSCKKKILLIKRRDVPVWVLPGGGIEEKETPQKAIIREVEEETGFKVKIKRKIAEYIPINKLSKFTYLFECEILSGKETIGKETKDICFFDLKKLPKLLPPPYEDWIKDSLKNHFVKKKLEKITYLLLLKNLILHPILVFRFLLSKMGFHLNSKG